MGDGYLKESHVAIGNNAGKRILDLLLRRDIEAMLKVLL